MNERSLLEMTMAMLTPRPLEEWHEDYGDVLWWLDPIEEHPYFGSPLDLGRSSICALSIGVEEHELTFNTGGWPFEKDVEHRLWWTPIISGNIVQKAIDDIQGRQS